jgi:RND family efflux transporter MFP subunit
VLPSLLVFGFVSLVAWASWDLVFPPQPVTVVPVLATQAEVRTEGTPLFRAAGWIEPRPTPVRVAALAPGVVQELLVVEDQRVKTNEPIAELVKDDARLAHERALADLKLRKAELDEAQAAEVAAQTRLEQPVHLQAALGEAEASLAKIETQLKNLPFDLRRAIADEETARKVYDAKSAAAGVVAGVDIDVAKGELDSAKALVEQLRDRADSLTNEKVALTRRRDALKTQLSLLADEIKARDAARANVVAATARVEQADVVVAETQLRLDRMTIRSPVDGRVFKLIGHPGARIGGGEQMAGYDGSTIVTLYRPDMLQVRVDVRFEDIPKVRLKQSVNIENPALPEPLTGTVLFVSSEANIQKNTLQVKVDIPDPPEVLKPEMLVDVTFLAPKETQQSETAIEEVRLYIPEQLLQQDDGGSFVWVADQSRGKAQRIRVETGAMMNGGLVQITSGLAVTSRIIVSGVESLRDGDRIRVIREHSSLGPALPAEE